MVAGDAHFKSVIGRTARRMLSALLLLSSMFIWFCLRYLMPAGRAPKRWAEDSDQPLNTAKLALNRFHLVRYWIPVMRDWLLLSWKRP